MSDIEDFYDYDYSDDGGYDDIPTATYQDSTYADFPDYEMIEDASADFDYDTDEYYDGDIEGQSSRTYGKNGVSHALEDRRMDEKSTTAVIPHEAQELLRSATNPISWRVESDIEDLYEPGNGEAVAFLKNWREIFAAAKPRPQTRVELGGSPKRPTPPRREPSAKGEPKKPPSEQCAAFVELSPSEFENAERAQFAVVITNTEQARAFQSGLPDIYDFSPPSMRTGRRPSLTRKGLYDEAQVQRRVSPQPPAALPTLVRDSVDSSRSLSPVPGGPTPLKEKQENVLRGPNYNKRKASVTGPDDKAEEKRPYSRRKLNTTETPGDLEAELSRQERLSIHGW